jgi:hypothetical protein
VLRLEPLDAGGQRLFKPQDLVDQRHFGGVPQQGHIRRGVERDPVLRRVALQDAGGAGMGILDVVDWVLVALLPGKVEVELELAVDTSSARKSEEAVKGSQK